MSWRVVVRPEAERDLLRAAIWYEKKKPGLGGELVQEVKLVFHALVDNPWLNSQRHPTKNIRWRCPRRFPYRVIYEIDESNKLVVVAAVLHAARHDSRWKRRFR